MPAVSRHELAGAVGRHRGTREAVEPARLRNQGAVLRQPRRRGGARVTVDAADLLAVLEERPYLEEELAELFGASADVVRVALKQLHRSCAVRRVGSERQWALITY